MSHYLIVHMNELERKKGRTLRCHGQRKNLQPGTEQKQVKKMGGGVFSFLMSRVLGQVWCLASPSLASCTSSSSQAATAPRNWGCKGEVGLARSGLQGRLQEHIHRGAMPVA